jgi:predicted Rossmann fold nucleotide-binding protein DprA/Smf involved in DNA uptake
MMNSWEIVEVIPPASVELFFHGKPPKLWGVGDAALLNHPLLGILSARQIDSDLTLKTSQLLKQLVSLKNVAFVSGWHSPLEEEALRILLEQEATIVLCVAKSLDRFIPSRGVESRVTDGKALLLTHCSTKAKRITRNASMRRNELIVDLAKSLLVLAAPEGSASLSLATAALRRGKLVLTPEHPMNKQLLASGALPATLDNLQTALR